ncbi:TPA: peptidoglycan DD-metalloendopeptidase family protein [Vibrio vulnificus]|nr:peptidoglycan DD-metalloendopeptidase family protein [Vibrio vulnificus]
MTSITLRKHSRILPHALFVIAAVVTSCVSLTHHLLTPTDDAPTIHSPQLIYSGIDKTNETYETYQIITGVVDYSFVSALINAGLSTNEIKYLIRLIKSNFDIFASVSKNDKFSIKVKTDSNNQTYISSFYYMGSKREIFIINDGKYNAYDEYGKPLSNEFYYSYPLEKKYKISSGFDLQRKHPITGQVTAHLGTDYIVPIGTSVYSIADGVVVKAQYNRFAGNYINIRHSNGSISRYLHLSRYTVQVGNIVSKGELIGLTGNSGRTTGPHLHLELIVDGVPVNYEHHVTESPLLQKNTNMIMIAQTEKAELIKELQKHLL